MTGFNYFSYVLNISIFFFCEPPPQDVLLRYDVSDFIISSQVVSNNEAPLSYDESTQFWAESDLSDKDEILKLN